MDFTYEPEDKAFRSEVRGWLADHLVGDFARVGGGYDLDNMVEARLAWEHELAAGGWIGLSWPEEHGGRGATLTQQLVFNEEYARSGAPQRAVFGESLLGPTLIQFGTEEQKQRFLPKILSAEELWCQGFSEPDAGSDLSSVKTRAVLDGSEWVLNGQKIWTSQAQFADWIFVLCRTSDAPRHKGLSYLLVPMSQAGVEVRPIRNLNGGGEFNEVFFTDASTAAELVVGGEGNGWKVAMGTLGFERGTAFLAQQVRFEQEYWRLVAMARHRGTDRDPRVRQRLASAYVGLEIMRYNGFRTVTAFMQGGVPGAESSIGKLFWSRWHQQLTELETDVLGPDAMILASNDDSVALFQGNFLFSRAHTIYAGASEIQRNIIGERVLGLPRDPER